MNYLRATAYDFALKIDGFLTPSVKEAFRILKDGELASLDELSELRNLAFVKLIQHSYKNVLYYKKIMDEYGISPTSIQSLDDLNRFPILTKDAVRSAGKELRAQNIPDNLCVPRRSGGTTGEPIISYVDRRAQALETYAARRGQQWMGWHPGIKIVQLFGGSLGLPEKLSLRDRARDYALGYVFLPAFGLNEKNVFEYIQTIDRAGECILNGYASALYNLAIYANELGVYPHNVKLVFSTSEVMPSEWKKTISKVFSCPVKSYYGCGEINSLGFQVKKEGSYWIPDEHVHLESINKEQHFHSDKEQTLLATTLFNFAQPLIRYENGDLGVVTKPGESHPTRHCISSLTGRSADMFIRTDGSRISSILGTYIIQRTQLPVKKYQIIQHAVDLIEFRYEPNEDISTQELQVVTKILRDYIGPKLKVEYNLTNEFLLSGAGKFRIMVVDPGVKV
jgi:phenylacetate-CoA ligase